MNSSDHENNVEILVIGAGAAGLMAAAAAADSGTRCLLVEKNRKPGVKILMSGGTRCNITQNTDNRGIVAAFGRQGNFLHSPLAALGVAETIAMFEAEGVATKIEPTGKIFPASDRATDVLAALVSRARRSGATLALDEAVLDIEQIASAAPEGSLRAQPSFRVQTGRRVLHAARLIVTTGGQSYPGCGTIGEGFNWARKFGHTIVSPRPALVPLTTSAAWVRELSGVTIPDVAVRIVPADVNATDGQGGRGKTKPLAERRGSFLFTHFGLSGPVVLDVSRAVSGHEQPQSLVLECNFLPSLERDAMLESLREQSQHAGRKQLASALPNLIPRRMVDALLASAGLSPEQRLAEVGAATRTRVVEAFTACRIPLSGTCGFKKAEVTAGGVALAEVDSRTMQSKLVPNLYLAGEVLDLDGPIGGYNFQAAWSTGHLAGQSAAQSILTTP